MLTESKKKKVCIFCQTWESGGIESFLYNVLTNVDITRFDIDLVVEELRESVFTEPLKALGIVFCELSGSTRLLWSNYRCFSKLMEERQYEVLHLNVFQAQAMMYLELAKRKEIPIRIAHSHNTMLRASRTRLIKILIHHIAKWLFSKNATDWWACSSIAAQFMFSKQSLKANSYQFIPNGIDFRKFRFNKTERQKLRQQLQLENCYVIGNIGRLCGQKNQKFLLEIFQELHQIVPEARLLLVGDGGELPELKRLAKTLEISDCVIFYGVSKHVESLMWAMDVFAFPSKFEGLGIVAIEAQAAGLPLVCSNQVPEEALVSPSAIRLTLDDRNAWIRTLAHLHNEICIEPSSHEWLSEFDIRHVAYQIETKYSS